MTTPTFADAASPEEYAALWGCDPCYDREPRRPGDGYLFYNFAVEQDDPKFLRKVSPRHQANHSVRQA